MCFKLELAELRRWHAVCLTLVMLKRVARLFTIKTRTEAWLIIYAIAVGAVERGRHYLETYPGTGGWLLALACTGVVFLAGAKLLDSVRPRPTAAVTGQFRAPQRRRRFSRNRPTAPRNRYGSGSLLSSRKD